MFRVEPSPGERDPVVRGGVYYANIQRSCQHTTKPTERRQNNMGADDAQEQGASPF